ncbi:MAG: amidohydrolase family protein [Actinophytocola sp.]|uniref:amidohydrolase family protein n=1 Tax=Actinophytocola sp. TaxID=1872138 RepID=UPI003D6C37B8
MSATDGVRLVDQHCHGVFARDLPAADFAAGLTEAPDPGGRDPWRSMLGLAVRRWCAPVLDLPAHATPEEYLARRTELGWREAATRLLRAAGVADWFVDTGYGGDTTPGELAELGGGTGHEVVRIEQVAESVASSGADTPVALLDGIRAGLRERAGSAVAFKSVIAYRSGLALPADPPSHVAVRAAADDWLRSGITRLRNHVLHAWLVHEAARVAAELGLPLQFHTGFGDPDLHLRDADPLLLTDFVRTTPADVVLLHCWPFHRNAAYLAHAFGHVWVDLGLTLGFAGQRAGAVLAETLELAPFESLLYSSDGCDLPERHHVGAVLWRHHLGRLLDEWLADGAITRGDAERLAEDFGAGNARRLSSRLAAGPDPR